MKMKCGKCREEYESETYPCSCPKCYPKTPTYETFLDHAEELLARFPGVDRAELLVHITGSYLMDFKYGNKREERAACDFLNLLQADAIKIKERASEPANGEVRDRAGNQQ